jgi:hypothetical protein
MLLDDVGAGELDLNLISCFSKDKTYLFNFLVEDDFKSKNRVKMSKCSYILSYVDEDIQMPTLTPNSIMFVGSNALPELEPHHLEETDLCRRARF